MKTGLLFQITFLFLFLTAGQSKKTTTKITPGVWTKWAPWAECSETCGIGVRRRVRFCSYDGTDKNRKCKGRARELKNCDTDLDCPVHGGWSSWVAWDCTVTCGGGDGTQKRTCTNPRPMFNGKECEGPPEEKGKCNTQKCPDEVYTLSPVAAQAVKNSIDNEYHNFERREGSSVKVPCSQLVVTKVFQEFPKTSIVWTKNGRILKLDHDRIDLEPTLLTINKLRESDSGVYVCSVHYAPQVIKPVTVAAISVTSSSPDIEVPAEHSLNLVCHGAQLSKIFKNVTQKWLLNGKEFKDFGKSSPVENNIYEINDIQKNMSGKWSCVIQDPFSNRKWTTNVVVIKVLPAISKFLRFLNNRNMILTIVISLFLLLMLFGTIFAFIIAKTREEFMAEFEKWCQVVGWEEEKAGGPPPWAVTQEKEVSLSEETETEDKL